MKTLLLISLIAAGTILPVSSQTPAAKSPLQLLQAIKAANAKLIDQQTKAVQRLDEVEKTSQEIKMLGKRS